MSQLTERDAEKLSSEQATALARVIELQAMWDGLLADGNSLQARQKANDAYQVALRDYRAKYPRAVVPEPTQAVPERLVVWYRVLRAVFAKAASGNPAAAMGKAYRLADRLAARMSKDPVGRAPTSDSAGALRELDIVIAWCEALVPKLKKAEAA